MTERPPVLLLHGIFSRPAFMAPWAERFEAAGYRCHAPAMPGRDPTDERVLRRAALPEFVAAARAACDRLDRPPIVIGHSMGGLVAQRLAAATDCAALVLLASVPPGMLWAQPRAMPHLIRLMPKILAGRPTLPSQRTLRAIPLNTLPQREQTTIMAGMVPDSGRAFRSLLVGSGATRVARGAIRCPVLCVSGGADLNVSARTSRSIARRCDAVHHVHPGKPHWIIAESALGDVAPPVLEWLDREVPRAAAR